jgi:hypothetical protein
MRDGNRAIRIKCPIGTDAVLRPALSILPVDIAGNVARHIEDSGEFGLPSVGDYCSVRPMMQILTMK